VTTPAVSSLSPTQAPISLLALRNHQLSTQTLTSFKAKPSVDLITISGKTQQSDVAPGLSTTGYVLIRAFNTSTPEIYQVDFGISAAGPLVEAVVI